MWRLELRWLRKPVRHGKSVNEQIEQIVDSYLAEGKKEFAAIRKLFLQPEAQRRSGLTVRWICLWTTR